MSCDICAKSNCCASFHTIEEQERYAKAIEAFERAREIRDQIRRDYEEYASEVEPDAS